MVELAMGILLELLPGIWSRPAFIRPSLSVLQIVPEKSLCSTAMRKMVKERREIIDKRKR